MNINLRNRRALVTGSTTGMGFAIAQGLLEAGATVILHGRTVEHVNASRAGKMVHWGTVKTGLLGLSRGPENPN